jgi:hypothetical protein
LREIRSAYKILVGNPEGKKLLGKPSIDEMTLVYKPI